MTAPYAYAVRYRRRDWNTNKGRKVRYFRDLEAAKRLVAKLRSPTYLSPVVELVIERQELGPVETVWTLGGEA